PRVASARWLLGVGEVALGAWLPVCAAKLRVSVDNVCDVGDERGWYARMAHVNHPVTLDAYRNHPFYDGALSSLRRVYARCPALSEAAAEARAGECRRVFLDEDGTRIAPIPDSAPVADGVDPRVTAVVPARAIGMLGYLYPPDVHVVDVHGLAEPIAARFELETRGRPGHEKQLTAAWLLARFAAPAPDEDASVTAARRALRCGALRSFVDAITAPMSARRFFLNLAQAWSNSRLRVPTDPFEAEVRFCGAPPMIVRSSGGEGGGPYRWRCPPGATLSGVRGAFKPADRAVSFVQALCSGDVARGAALVGPRWGEASSPATFELGCPSDATLIGLHGTSDNLVRSVAPLCVRRGQPLQVPAAGAGGRRFTLECPDGREPVGIAGRAGDLVDAVGLLCPPRDGAGSP
ncbi:MAG TPA: hypothetical protein VE987_22915, partial [Polyangiaceae bacterium]|nr:hypothetical protein [Polyangiaceae bacterium]